MPRKRKNKGYKKQDEEENRGKPKGIILLIVLIAILLIVDIFAVIIYTYKPAEQQQEQVAETEIKVEEVIDGDTFKLTNGEYVRLIGINAPEKDMPYYLSSLTFLKLLILDKEIILEKDKDDRDNFGRLLRYAYVDYGDETLFVNYELVRRGYAIPLFVEPNLKYKEKIDEARKTCLNEKNNICVV